MLRCVDGDIFLSLVELPPFAGCAVFAMTYVFNMAVAAIFLHESISMVQLVGVALIVGGIIVANQG